MAAAVLARAEAARVTRTLATGLGALGLRPGDCIAIDGENGSWRITDTAVEGYVVTLTLTPLAPVTLAARGSSGTVLAAPDLAIGTTLLAAFETPSLGDTPLTAPRLTVAATGTGVGWRQAALLISTDGGASWTAAGGTAAPAVLGTLATVPAAAGSTLFDLAGSIEVDLARPDLVLEDADDDRLDAGANLAMAGEELIQFGRAEPLGGRRWRLSRLLRGRRGSEAAAGTQAVGDRFVLLAGDSIRTIDLPLAALGGQVRVMASGAGDGDGPVEVTAPVTGRSVLPPSPVHLAVTRGGDGGAQLGWVRRSRAGWRWLDGADVPLAEESEAYDVALTATGGSAAGLAVATCAAGLDPGTVGAAVRQRGTYGLSDAAVLQINEGE